MREKKLITPDIGIFFFFIFCLGSLIFFSYDFFFFYQHDKTTQKRRGLTLPYTCLYHTVPKYPIYVFPEKELRGLSPNSYIHVSVIYLFIPRIAPHIPLQIDRPII
jgi:hypothetical protein